MMRSHDLRRRPQPCARRLAGPGGDGRGAPGPRVAQLHAGGSCRYRSQGIARAVASRNRSCRGSALDRRLSTGAGKPVGPPTSSRSGDADTVQEGSGRVRGRYRPPGSPTARRFPRWCRRERGLSTLQTAYHSYPCHTIFARRCVSDRIATAIGPSRPPAVLPASGQLPDLGSPFSS